MADDHGHLTTDQICRQLWKPIDVTVRPAILDGDILPLDETRFFQALPECDDEVRRVGGRCDPQEADHRHGCLLGACDARPSRRRAAEKRDEIAPSHCLPQGPGQGTVSGRFSDVRFGSKADICAAKTHVRFTPNSDRKSGFPQKAMSALPSKADMCGATRDVCFGPKSGHVASGHRLRLREFPCAVEDLGARAIQPLVNAAA
jgi:hypothetical protein